MTTYEQVLSFIIIAGGFFALWKFLFIDRDHKGRETLLWAITIGFAALFCFFPSTDFDVSLSFMLIAFAAFMGNMASVIFI